MDSQAMHPGRKTGRDDHTGRIAGYRSYSTGDAGSAYDSTFDVMNPPNAPERGPAGPLGRVVNKGLNALGVPESEGRVGKVSRADKKTYKQNLKTYKKNQGK